MANDSSQNPNYGSPNLNSMNSDMYGTGYFEKEIYKNLYTEFPTNNIDSQADWGQSYAPHNNNQQRNQMMGHQQPIGYNNHNQQYNNNYQNYQNPQMQQPGNQQYYMQNQQYQRTQPQYQQQTMHLNQQGQYNNYQMQQQQQNMNYNQQQNSNSPKRYSYQNNNIGYMGSSGKLNNMNQNHQHNKKRIESYTPTKKNLNETNFQQEPQMSQINQKRQIINIKGTMEQFYGTQVQKEFLCEFNELIKGVNQLGNQNGQKLEEKFQEVKNNDEEQKRIGKNQEVKNGWSDFDLDKDKFIKSKQFDSQEQLNQNFPEVKSNQMVKKQSFNQHKGSIGFDQPIDSIKL